MKFIRKGLLKRREEEGIESLVEKSNKIKQKLFQLDELRNAGTVMFYMSTKNEVMTHDMIKESLKRKKVVVPVVKGRKLELSELEDFTQLVPSTFGILEPRIVNAVEPRDVDLFIVPGVAFDKTGNRIGYGKGYFDKLLVEARAPIVALSYEFQIISSIRAKHWDVKVNKIITESNIIECGA